MPADATHDTPPDAGRTPAAHPWADERLALTDAMEMAWVILANVSGGDWTKQSDEWREAAARWRDEHMGRIWAHMTARVAAGPTPPGADA